MPSTDPPIVNAPSAEELQSMLDRYHVVRQIGQGGMGAVYEGIQAELERRVAIKVLPDLADDTEAGLKFAERFRLEAKSMANLDHPGIVSVYDFGQTSRGQLYFVMEFIDGMDIYKYVQESGGKLNCEDATTIVVNVLDALEYAHARGVIHRDIKPANVMITSEGRVKLADFGLVKRFATSLVTSQDSNGMTMTDVVLGTPDYVAPEALEAGRAIDHRVDLYAVGVMLYQLLTGTIPRGSFKPVSEFVPGIRARLDDVTAKAMAPDPEERYASAAEFRKALNAAMKESSAASQGPRLVVGSAAIRMAAQASPVNDEPQVRTVQPRNGLSPAALVSIITVILLGIGVGIFFLTQGGGRNTDTPDLGASAPTSPTSSPDGSGEDDADPPSEPAPSQPVVETDPETQPIDTKTPTEPVEPADPDGVAQSPPNSDPGPADSDSTPPDPVPPVEPAGDIDPIAKRLESIESKYREARGIVADGPFESALATLNQQFVSALNREEQLETQAGVLEAVLFYQNERKRIESGEGAGESDEEEAPEKLKTLRQTWHAQYRQLQETKEANLLAPLADWDRALELYQQELVRAEDIPGAQRVKEVRDGLAADMPRSGSDQAATTVRSPDQVNGLAPGKLSGAAQVGASLDLSPAEGIDDVVSISVGRVLWAAVRSNGEVVSSEPWLHGERDVAKVIFETHPFSSKAWIIKKGGRVEGAKGRGPNDLRSAIDFYHNRAGHGAAITTSGRIEVWGASFEDREKFDRPPVSIENAVQVTGSFEANEFCAAALLDDGKIVSWGHKNSIPKFPEGKLFQGIMPRKSGILVLTRDGEVFDCTSAGTTPFHPDKGPFVEIYSIDAIKAARREDGSWIVEAAKSQMTIKTTLEKLGPVGTVGFSGGILLWTNEVKDQ